MSADVDDVADAWERAPRNPPGADVDVDLDVLEHGAVARDGDAYLYVDAVVDVKQ